MIGARRIPEDYPETRFKDNGAPLLEIDERTQLYKFVMDQEKELHSYGWVDQGTGVAHIPIDRAMELIAQRGLPVCPDGCAKGTAKTSAPAPAKAVAAK
jgi:hypothetical protein